MYDDTDTMHEMDETAAVKPPGEGTMYTITNLLMSRQNHYVSPKSHSEKRDIQVRKFGVRATSLDDFVDCLRLLSGLLWEVDPHYHKMQSHGGGRFPALMIQKGMDMQ